MGVIKRIAGAAPGMISSLLRVITTVGVSMLIPVILKLCIGRSDAVLVLFVLMKIEEN
jgi:hypothetical protein